MSAPSTSGLSVELLLRVIDVKYGCFTLLYFTLLYFTLSYNPTQHRMKHRLRTLLSLVKPTLARAIETKQESKKEYKDLKNH